MTRFRREPPLIGATRLLVGGLGVFVGSVLVLASKAGTSNRPYGMDLLVLVVPGLILALALLSACCLALRRTHARRGRTRGTATAMLIAALFLASASLVLLVPCGFALLAVL